MRLSEREHYSVISGQYPWPETLRAAGFEPYRRDGLDHETVRSCVRTEIQTFADEYGRPPTPIEMNNRSEFGVYWCEKLFGSWRETLQEAGFESSRAPHNVGEEELLDEIERLRDQLGRIPSLDDLAEHGQYSCAPFYRQFGLWTTALHEAGYEPRQNTRDTSSTRGGHVYYGPRWNEIVATIHERDNHQCRVCGVDESEGTGTGARHLQVHHITPAREFGAHRRDVETDYEVMNDPDNLVTLCQDCHGIFEGQWIDCDVETFVYRARASRKCEEVAGISPEPRAV